ncbi:MAG: NfeD family protein [Microthrixaceae bacterium]
MGTLPSHSPHGDKYPTNDDNRHSCGHAFGRDVGRDFESAPRSARRSILGRAAALIILVVASLAIGTVFPAEASARSSCGDDGCVDVIQVDGIIDDIVADFISQSVRRANNAGDVVAVVLQIDSLGTAVSHERLNELAAQIRNSTVPISAWVGASGARAYGGSAELVLVADSSGIAPGARIGDIGVARVDPALLRGDSEIDPESADRVFEGKAAVKAGLIDRFDPTLVDHIGNLDAVDSKVVTVDGNKQRQPVQRVRLSKLPLPVQIMHTAASPAVAYLLLVIGSSLLLFEFFTAGVGVAGVVGAGFVILGGYGLAELPFRPWALALFVASFVAFAIDMQTGLARLWTWIGFVAFTVSSLFLLSEFPPTWLALITGIAGMALVVFPGMPSMNRARFGTPYIGREWLEGETGRVVDPLTPNGTVRIGEVEWTARGAEGVEIASGTTVTVTGSDRMTIEVSTEASAGTPSEAANQS